MTAADDDRFWLHEADPAVDICDLSLTVDACLAVIVPELAAHVALERATVLDVGCGIGRLTNPFQARYPSARMVGTDITGRFLAQARSGRPFVGKPVYHLTGTVTHLTGVDAAYSMCVFQHLDGGRKADYLRQLGRSLRPGGVVVVQFVEGSHQSRCMYDATTDAMTGWSVEAGLKVVNVSHDLLMPRWSWLTAVREAAT